MEGNKSAMYQKENGHQLKMETSRAALIILLPEGEFPSDIVPPFLHILHPPYAHSRVVSVDSTQIERLSINTRSGLDIRWKVIHFAKQKCRFVSARTGNWSPGRFEEWRRRFRRRRFHGR